VRLDTRFSIALLAVSTLAAAREEKGLSRTVTLLVYNNAGYARRVGVRTAPPSANGELLFTSQQSKLIRVEARRRLSLHTRALNEQRLATVDQ
jgi:hypothetical protein